MGGRVDGLRLPDTLKDLMHRLRDLGGRGKLDDLGGWRPPKESDPAGTTM